jgi:hypothetical protein
MLAACCQAVALALSALTCMGDTPNVQKGGKRVVLLIALKAWGCWGVRSLASSQPA